MNNKHDDKNKIAMWQPDSLMDLLIAQCSDLEGLLALARRETVAADNEDFGELLAVFDDRARVGDRLESYHRQVAELRDRLGQGIGAYIDPALSSKTAQLVVEIQVQDLKTTALLRATQIRTGLEISQLDHSQRNASAYLHDPPSNGLKCDRRG